MATGCWMSARRSSSRYCVVPASGSAIRHAPESAAGAVVGRRSSGSSTESMGVLPALAWARSSCGPSAVGCQGAVLENCTSTRSGEPPGQTAVSGERSGAAAGGITTETAAEGSERPASVPSSSSAVPQATARYQTRFQEPPGSSWPVARCRLTPSGAGSGSMVQPLPLPEMVATGGPMASSDRTAASARVRNSSKCDTCAPGWLRMSTWVAQSEGVPVAMRRTSSKGAGGMLTCGATKRCTCSINASPVGHADSILPALTPMRT